MFLMDLIYSNYMVFPGDTSGKESTCQCRSKRLKRRGFNPWVRKISCSRKWQPTPVSLLGKFHGQSSLMGYSPQDHKEQGTTEHCYLDHKNIWFLGTKTNNSNNQKGKTQFADLKVSLKPIKIDLHKANPYTTILISKISEYVKRILQIN